MKSAYQTDMWPGLVVHSYNPSTQEAEGGLPNS
jgi:hypothetical protein